MSKLTIQQNQDPDKEELIKAVLQQNQDPDKTALIKAVLLAAVEIAYSIALVKHYTELVQGAIDALVPPPIYPLPLLGIGGYKPVPLERSLIVI